MELSEHKSWESYTNRSLEITQTEKWVIKVFQKVSVDYVMVIGEYIMGRKHITW